MSAFTHACLVGGSADLGPTCCAPFTASDIYLKAVKSNCIFLTLHLGILPFEEKHMSTRHSRQPWPTPRHRGVAQVIGRPKILAQDLAIGAQDAIICCTIVENGRDAQGGGECFKNRKPIGQELLVSMAEQKHCYIHSRFKSPLFRSLSSPFSDYSPTYLPIYYV